MRREAYEYDPTTLGVIGVLVLGPATAEAITKRLYSGTRGLLAMRLRGVEVALSVLRDDGRVVALPMPEGEVRALYALVVR